MSKSPVDPVELAEAVLRRLKDREELVPLRNADGACTECGAGEGEHEPGCIFKKLEHEVELAKEEWVEVCAKIGPAQEEYNKALDEEDKHKDFDKPLPAEVEKATDRTVHALWAWMDRKVVLENTIKKLQSPQEIERRRNTSNHLKEVRKVANNKKETAKDQGVPGTYLGAGGNFKPGLDARFKSDLITSALGEKIGPEGMHQFTRDAALEFLAKRGWLPHLEKAKKSRDAKAAKKAEKAKAKATPRTTRTSSTKGKGKATPRRSSSKKA